MRRLLFAFVLFLCAVPTAFAQSEEVADEIVAVVGDAIILRSEVDGIVQAFAQQQRVDVTDGLWLDALGQLIDQKVLAVHARRDTTIEVSDAQVEQALDGRIAQLQAQVGGEAQLEALYGKSVLQIKSDLRDEFRDQLLADQLRSRKVRGIRITPTEVRTWFQRIADTDSLPTLPEIVRVAHIVRYPEVTEAARRDAREVLNAIRTSIVDSTETFEDMATRYTEDPGSARTGGRYQNSRLGDLAPEFAAVAARIEPGDVSQVFETQFGLHILRVNERRGDVVDFNHVLIKFDESKFDAEPAIAYLNTVRDSLLSTNIPFEVMARRHSEESFSKDRGGRVVDPQSLNRDLPLQALGFTWQRSLEGLEVGKISQPREVELLDGTRGYHIVLLQRRTPAHEVSLETDYERIEQIALQEKQAEELNRWVTRLRDDVYVDLRGKAARLDALASDL